jgi:hypothetical protein
LEVNLVVFYYPSESEIFDWRGLIKGEDFRFTGIVKYYKIDLQERPPLL